MNEEINIENLNTIENITIMEDQTVYDVCKNIHTVVTVIAFTIIIIFMFRYLKDTFKFKN